jgi:hypothetical protein
MEPKPYKSEHAKNLRHTCKLQAKTLGTLMDHIFLELVKHPPPAKKRIKNPKSI